VRELVAAATHRTAVVWDPHPRGSAPVAGVRLATPNRQEAADLSAPPAATDPGPSSPLAQVQRQADDLVRRWAAHAVSVTLGAGGALLSYGSGSPLVVPAAGVPARDTCGAGDRYAATATAVLASGGLVSEAVQAAVRDATRFVAAGGAGTVPARPAAAPPAEAVPARGWDRVEQVRATGGTVVATGGCFDLLHAGHVELLRAARGLGDALVVLLNSDASVRRLKGPDRPLVPHEDRARVLEALACVDAVMVFGEDRPDAALRRLRPQVWVKGGDYALTDLPEAAALREWGGQAVVLPYLDGRSTSGLIGAARAAAAEGRR
jgi:rfaE bifunctional protein nucleotidyltransferase chain/domain